MKKISVLKRESDLKQLLASIITLDLTNSNIIAPTVVDVELAGDLSHAKVYLSFGANEKDGLEAVQNATGYIKKMLAKSLNWRKVPNLQFEIDSLSKTSERISKILKEIKDEK